MSCRCAARTDRIFLLVDIRQQYGKQSFCEQVQLSHGTVCIRIPNIRTVSALLLFYKTCDAACCQITYHAKTAEPIEMLLGMWTRVGQRNNVLDGRRNPDT